MTTDESNHFSVESVEPMSDRPHAREVARERITDYRARQSTQYLTQAMIDGQGSRETVLYTRRAVKFHRVSLFRKIRNWF